MELKFIEIRDVATCIPVIALEMASSDKIEDFYLRKCGFGRDFPSIVLIKLSDFEATYDPYNWKYGRTMKEAHRWIQNHYAELKSGDVVDVEFILSEKPQPKKAERPDDLENIEEGHA